jgi:hypothetical protein
MKARVSQLHKTEAEWNNLPDFIPMKGELIIFEQDTEHQYARIKIGDGNTPLIELPFFIDNSINRFIEDNFYKVIDGGRITAYKK